MKSEIKKVYAAHKKKLLTQNEAKTMKKEIEQVYESHKNLVLEKNKRYGNSALSPLGIFYKGGAPIRLRCV